MKNKIEILPGISLESVVNTLLEAKSRNESVYCEFNNHLLYSDTISMDNAYLQVFNQTKKEFEKQKKLKSELLKEKQKLQKDNMQKNIIKWVEKGESLIYEEKHIEWRQCVIGCAKDISLGYELDCALEIMQEIENKKSLKEVSKILNKQKLSGLSASLVKNIIFNFSSKGPEFIEETSYKEMSLEDKTIIKLKKAKNKKLAIINKPKIKTKNI